MSIGFSILIIFLAIVSGLIGGAVFCRLFAHKAITRKTIQSILTVEGLRVVDKSDKLLMEFGKSDKVLSDTYGLYIFGKDGKIEASMGIEACNGGFVNLSDRTGEGFAMMSVDESGASVTIFGKGGKIGAGMRVDESGGNVSVSSRIGEGSAMMSVNESGGNVTVFGKGSNGSASVSVDEFGGNVTVFGKSSNGSASVGVDEFGGVVIAHGKDRKGLAMMSVDESGGTVNLWDKNGNELWKV
ncbi:MAG: hypothetical protein QG641_773 [Candidatus Poribacteria bacterium]|nr:hypothetical protein [Candidatus Poribacteria bacterium]